MSDVDVRSPTHVRSFKGRRGKVARTSRGLNPDYQFVTMSHRPTGIEVKGEVPLGHYSRAEMKRRVNELKRELWFELEGHVAARLGKPRSGLGRCNPFA